MTDIYSHSDEKLLQEIMAGDMSAFDILYSRYSKRIYKFAFSILKLQEDAENIVQDVYLNLWEKKNEIKTKASVRSYIFTIVYNSSVSVLRKKSRESQYSEYLKSIQNLEQSPVDMELEYNELNNKFNEVKEQLPERQREIYKLHRFEGLKYQEIADKMNISVNTVENHMSRALKTIREKIGNYSLAVILFCWLFV
jgi:RNA polymerase sigma-70 factor, ECF subfamily